jgi:hypothetical protein
MGGGESAEGGESLKTGEREGETRSGAGRTIGNSAARARSSREVDRINRSQSVAVTVVVLHSSPQQLGASSRRSFSAETQQEAPPQSPTAPAAPPHIETTRSPAATSRRRDISREKRASPPDIPTLSALSPGSSRLRGPRELRRDGRACPVIATGACLAQSRCGGVPGGCVCVGFWVPPAGGASS